ncbi:MAG: phospholipid carrier-dependent glycosyltransferase [Candidatus Omnitrophica bacterium]|nr:phospholipid carrier-dependent glycosyltransferase [Candidatus Omnitrophota bacterium]
MDFLKKDNYLNFLVLFTFLFFLLGINWGIPSKKVSKLYFYKKDHLEKILFKIKEHKQEIWKGYGYYLVLHPEEEEKKLPRSYYNPIRSYHPDEYFIIKVFASMNPEKLDFNPHQFAVGGAYLYLIGVILYFLSKIKVIKLTKDLSFYFYNPEEIGKFYVVGRLITLFHGVGIIVLTYLIIKKLYNDRKNAFLISILLLFTPLIILNSSYMYVDIPGLFWITMCLYYSLKTFENLNNKNYFLAGIFSGLACGTKINLFISILIPIFALILKCRNIKNFLFSLLYIVGGFILSFGITNPYFFLTFPMPIVELKQHTPIKFSGKFYVDALIYGLGWPVFILCLIGLIFNKKNFILKERTLLFLWILSFFLFISLFSKNYARYILPILPCFLVLGCEFWLKKSNYRLNKFLKLTFFYFCLIYTIFYGLSFKNLLVKENIRTECGLWIKENIPTDKSIGVCEIPWQFQLPPFDYFEYELIIINYNFEKLKKILPEYFVISSFQAPVPPYPSNLEKEKIDFWNEFLNSNLYTLHKSFQKFPSLGIINFKFEILPEDLIYLNPTILIFKKNGRNF